VLPRSQGSPTIKLVARGNLDPVWRGEQHAA
jgi:hypothetical protein